MSRRYRRRGGRNGKQTRRNSPRPTDFVAAWRSVNCKHASVMCAAYSNQLMVICNDCGLDMDPVLKGDGFHVFGRHPTRPDAAVDYGMHGVDEVAKFVRERVTTISLPDTMADKMSVDPERDAAGITAMVVVLDACGLIKVINGSSNKTNKLVNELSVMRATRSQFEARAKYAAKVIGETGICVTEDGRNIPVRQGLEAARLAWPCRFEGADVGVRTYNADGYGGVCPKCGFDALDAGAVDWRRGCREHGCGECGYVGYLLGI